MANITQPNRTDKGERELLIPLRRRRLYRMLLGSERFQSG